MELMAAINVLQSGLLIILLWVILFWFWPSVRLDCFRQHMFSVRDELFDYALSGKISFSHPAYRLLRQSMNGFIRYGHRLTFFQAIVTHAAWKIELGKTSAWNKSWKEALATLDEATRKEMERFFDRAYFLVVRRLVLGSPVLIAALALVALLLICHLGLVSVRVLARSAMSKTASMVIDREILNEEAAAAAAH